MESIDIALILELSCVVITLTYLGALLKNGAIDLLETGGGKTARNKLAPDTRRFGTGSFSKQSLQHQQVLRTAWFREQYRHQGMGAEA